MSKGLTRELQRLKERMRMVAAATALEAAQETLRIAQERVPVITGQLKSGGEARMQADSPQGSQATTFYIAPYAPDVHENPNGRGYKWLEMSANQVDMLAILRKRWEGGQ